MLKGHVDLLEDQPEDGPVVRLLPAFDPYMLGYRRRDLGVNEQIARRVHPGGGVIRPTVLVDGRAAGTWSLRRAGGTALIAVSPFECLLAEIEEGIGTEAADVGRFLGVEATVKIEAAR